MSYRIAGTKFVFYRGSSPLGFVLQWPTFIPVRWSFLTRFISSRRLTDITPKVSPPLRPRTPHTSVRRSRSPSPFPLPLGSKEDFPLPLGSKEDLPFPLPLEAWYSCKLETSFSATSSAPAMRRCGSAALDKERKWDPFPQYPLNDPPLCNRHVFIPPLQHTRQRTVCFPSPFAILSRRSFPITGSPNGFS